MGRKFEPCWDHHMKPETKFWKLVKQKTEHKIHWTRIESWAGQGIPDLFGISEGINVFVELKVTKSNSLGLSPFQMSWHYNHILNGGRSFIMLQHLSQRLLCVVPCFHIHSPSSIALDSSPQYSVKLPASPADWAAVVDFLLHSPFPLAKDN